MTIDLSEKRRRRKNERNAAMYDQDVFELLQAIDTWRRKNDRSFPAWSEVLQILKSLGWRKTEAVDALQETTAVAAVKVEATRSSRWRWRSRCRRRVSARTRLPTRRRAEGSARAADLLEQRGDGGFPARDARKPPSLCPPPTSTSRGGGRAAAASRSAWAKEISSSLREWSRSQGQRTSAAFSIEA